MTTHTIPRVALKPGAPPRDVVEILKKFSERVPERWIDPLPDVRLETDA